MTTAVFSSKYDSMVFTQYMEEGRQLTSENNNISCLAANTPIFIANFLVNLNLVSGNIRVHLNCG